MDLTWISTAGHPDISKESQLDLEDFSLLLEEDSVEALYLGPLGFRVEIH